MFIGTHCTRLIFCIIYSSRSHYNTVGLWLLQVGVPSRVLCSCDRNYHACSSYRYPQRYSIFPYRHSGTALYETYAASQGNLDVYPYTLLAIPIVLLTRHDWFQIATKTKIEFVQKLICQLNCYCFSEESQLHYDNCQNRNNLVFESYWSAWFRITKIDIAVKKWKWLGLDQGFSLIFPGGPQRAK